MAFCVGLAPTPRVKSRSYSNCSMESPRVISDKMLNLAEREISEYLDSLAIISNVGYHPAAWLEANLLNKKSFSKF